MNNKHPQKPMSPAMQKNMRLKRIFVSLIALGGCILGVFAALTIMKVTGFLDYLYGDKDEWDNDNRDEEVSYEDLEDRFFDLSDMVEDDETIYLFRPDGTEMTVENPEEAYSKTDDSLPFEERWYFEKVIYGYAVYEKDDTDPRGYSNKYAGGDEDGRTIVTRDMRSWDDPNNGILYFEEPLIYVKVTEAYEDAVIEMAEVIALTEYQANPSKYEVITKAEYDSGDNKYFKCNYCSQNHPTFDHVCSHCGGREHESQECCTVCQRVTDHKTDGHICERCKKKGHGIATCEAEECTLCFEYHATSEHVCTNCKGKGHESRECCTICQRVTGHQKDGHICERCGIKGHGEGSCNAQVCDICGKTGHDRAGHVCEKCSVVGHSEKDTHCKDCGKYGHADKKDSRCDRYKAPKECDYCGGDHDSRLHICVRCEGIGHGEDDTHCEDCGQYGHSDKTYFRCREYSAPYSR